MLKQFERWRKTNEAWAVYMAVLLTWKLSVLQGQMCGGQGGETVGTIYASSR